MALTVGIEKINMYSSSLVLDLAKLAEVRNRDLVDLHNNLLLRRRSVNPLYEDIVTMAVNAAKPILTDEDKKNIELCIVGTESAVDFGKPASTWVHRFLGINPNCRSFETKHACYSSGAGYIAALHWLASGVAPGKKALVIASDFSRQHLGAEHEFVLGGAAVAMLLSTEPKIIKVELERSAYWTTEIADTFRPTSKVEMGNSETSLYSYTDALEGSIAHFIAKNPDLHIDQSFKRHIYHMPFPGMTQQAHRILCRHAGITKKSEARESWERKVAKQVTFGQEVGSSYSGSTFIGLLGTLHGCPEIKGGDRTTVYIYGSGCQGEFYSAQFIDGARDRILALNLEAHLADRHEITVDEYEAVEKTRETYVDNPNVKPDFSGYANWYDRHYKGRGYLVLKGIENYYRHYEWS